MIKSLAIRDIRDNRVMFRLLWRKSGVYELTMDAALHARVAVEVRDEKGHKVIFGGKKK